MATHAQIEEWLQEEIEKALEAGVPISRDIDPKVEFPKAQSFYGQCYKRDSKHPFYAYRIRISEYFLPAKESEIRQTIMHELIHTCPGCMNHGNEWKKWVGVINRKYNYDIARLGEYHEFSLHKEADKHRRKASNASGKRYLIECPGCGRSWTRTRRSRATENLSEYCCPHCKNYGQLTLKVLQRM